jgi:hypothetical protein
MTISDLNPRGIIREGSGKEKGRYGQSEKG